VRATAARESEVWVSPPTPLNQEHVFWDADEITVAQSKSDAGEGRRVPMVGPLKLR
jgi:hypothetical protein